jgi:hypothetical protein
MNQKQALKSATPLPSNNGQLGAINIFVRLLNLINSRRFQFLLSFVILGSLMLSMLHISWEKWGDTIVDTGREVYIPWQLSEGKVLYRDIFVNQYGPLSVYINALLFLVFGVRLMTLSLFNILLTIGFALYFYRIFLKESGIFIATVNVFIFLALFAFSDITGLGIFNFVSPYSYAVTYSLALSLGALYFLDKYRRSQSHISIFFSGIWIGLVFLCKYEAFVAIAVCFFAYWILVRPTRKYLSSIIGSFAAAFSGFTLPILGFLAYFSIFMPFHTAFSSIMQQYKQMFEMRVVNNNFYRMIAGTLDIKESLTKVVQSILFYDLLAVLGLACAYLIVKIRFKGWRIAACATIGLGLFTAVTMHALNEPYLWLYVAFSGLPVVLCAAIGFQIFQILRKKTPNKLNQYGPLAGLSLFSLVFLAKISLNMHALHYGFVLAMPATLVGAWILIDRFPIFVERKFPGAYWMIAVLGLLAVYGILLSHYNLSAFSYAQKELPIGDKNDRLITWKSTAVDVYYASFNTTHERGIVFKEILDELKRTLRPEDTLLVIPEGALFNYFTRHRNPTPYTSFLLGDLVMFDESKIVKDLERTYPDYIVLADRDLQFYGYNSFGVDTGRAIMNWVNQNYVAMKQIGPTPFKGLGFGARILKRSAESSKHETMAYMP